MKRLLLWLCCLLPLAATAQNDPAEKMLEARIQSVRVYPDRAAITETASQMVQPGTHLLVFTKLPESLVPGSITVSGTGSGTIQSVSERISYLNRSASTARITALEDSVQRLSEAIQTLNDRQFVLEEEEKLLLKNSELKGDETGLNVDNLVKLADIYRKRLAEVRMGKMQNASMLREASKRMTRVRAELNQLRAGRDQPTKEVVVTFKADAATKVTLELKYLATGAAWAPRYDLRVTALGQPVTILMKADVINGTGRDWDKVRLSLSTANPAEGGTPPEWEAQYIDIYSPVAYGSSMRMRAAKAQAAPAPTADAMVMNEVTVAGSGDEEEDAPEAASSTDYITTIETSLSVEYDIALPYDLPADGKARQVDVRQLQAQADYGYYTYPRTDGDAFLLARIGGWEQLGLLPGTANVYFEGAFIAETTISPDTRDTLNIGLGRDARVPVKREQVRDFTSRKTLGSQIRETRGYTIEVRNAKKEVVRITVEDNVPVSQNAAVEVKLAEGHGGQYNPYTGRITWTFELKPGESRKLAFSFEVKYPKDRQVTPY